MVKLRDYFSGRFFNQQYDVQEIKRSTILTIRKKHGNAYYDEPEMVPAAGLEPATP